MNIEEGKPDNFSINEYWLLIEDKTIAIVKQYDGEQPIQQIEIPIKDFNKIVEWYNKNKARVWEYEQEEAIKNIPQKIYLTLGLSKDELPVDFNDLRDVSWCRNKIYETDIEYKLSNNE